MKLRYKDSSSCIHLTIIKNFLELQKEFRIFNSRPVENEILLKFYILSTCIYINVVIIFIFAWSMCGTCRFSLLIIHQVSINLKYMYLWEPLLLINPFLFLFWCKTIPGVLSDDWQQVSSIWKPTQTSNVVYRTEGEKLKRTCEEKLNWSSNRFFTFYRQIMDTAVVKWDACTKETLSILHQY